MFYMKRFVLTRFTTSKLTDFTEHKFENFSTDSLMEQNNNDTGKIFLDRKLLSGKRRLFNIHQM
jgi:hypothetical protein